MNRFTITAVTVVAAAVVFFSGCESSPKAGKTEEATASAQSASLSPAQRIAQIQSELKNTKLILNSNGEYDCCVQPACNWCLLNEGSCDCYDNLKAGEEVCPGCGLGWHEGHGVDKTVKASQVKWGITHEHEEHEEHEHHQ